MRHLSPAGHEAFKLIHARFVRSAGTTLMSQPPVDFSVQLGRLRLRNPILAASGTFGYAREMERLVDFGRLGGILPKTVTKAARIGNKPWRTVETACGLLNSIGLDNDGIDAFIEHHLPYLRDLPTAIIVSIAGRDHDEFVSMAAQLDGRPGVAAIELNISCPNVSGGVDFGADAAMCGRLVEACRKATSVPIIAKLTPNVTSIVPIARAAAEAGADAISLINTVLGIAIDWRKRRPMLGNVMGGLSGPAIKPIALRCVYQVAQAVKTPLIGIGGIATIDDVMEFFVAGATAVQVGTANYYDPTVTMKLVDALPAALVEAGVSRVREVVGSLGTSPAEP
jgi:dihydroorotate dehydrogenase (NAD+) catalytic subunit